MYILAVETSTPKGSIAISRDDELLYFEDWSRPKGRPRRGEKFLSHSEMVGIAIERGLRKTNLSLKNMNHLVTSIGPGSFTGIRVGLASIKSYSFALNLPCSGYESLKTLAMNGINQRSTHFSHDECL
ncbi:MAG: tRNA (adenosine(37)-N6)-threonylcarbamoyltransferase complex dimerization subunit type 1 TsaB [Bdellovibrionales bacterium]